MELQDDVAANAQSRPPGTGDFWDILTNERRTVLYIGITNNLEMRVSQHLDGQGSAFTRKYRLSCLVYHENFPDPVQAIVREKQLKGWTRAKKVALISKSNPGFVDLTPILYRREESSTVLNRDRNEVPRGPSTPLRSAQDDCVFQHDDHE